MKRIRLVQELAPAAPPCFSSRDIWLSFITSAAEAQRAHGGIADPLVFHPGGRVEFNHRMDFCADCMPSFSQQMQRVGRCNPDHLLQCQPAPLLPQTTTSE